MIAIGVVVVGRLFGFVGLFVAVPILSLIVIVVEEFWVKKIEEIDAERRSSPDRAPGSSELGQAMTIPISTKMTIRTCTTIQKRGSCTGAPYSMSA